MISGDRAKRAIGLRILSGIFISGMYICVKAVGEVVPDGEIVFFDPLSPFFH